jgi:hypothetical protein
MSQGYPVQTPFDPGYGQPQQGYMPQGHSQPPANWGQQGGPPEPDLGGFDVNEFPDGRLADGTYSFVVSDTSMSPTKAGTGWFLKVTAELNNGQNAYLRFNVQNPNPDAERIAKQELAKLVRGLGLQFLRSHRDLVGKRGSMTVSHRIDKRGQEQENYRFENPAAPQSAPVQYVPPGYANHPAHPNQAPAQVAGQVAKPPMMNSMPGNSMPGSPPAAPAQAAPQPAFQPGQSAAPWQAHAGQAPQAQPPVDPRLGF